MLWLEQLYVNPFIVFTLVLARIGGLIASAPMLGFQEMPVRVRAILAVSLALLMTPGQLGGYVSPPGNLVDYTLLLVAETLIGLTLGIGLQILFSGIHLAGQIIGQLSGMSLADVFNPGFDMEVPIFSQLLYYVTMAVFVLIGGHRSVIDALLTGFQRLPPGGGNIPDTLAETAVTLLSQSFVLGVRAAAPAMVSLLLATLVMGLIGRALPQLNILSLGFGVNVVVTLAALMLSLGAIAWVFQQHLDPAIETILGAFGDTGTPGN